MQRMSSHCGDIIVMSMAEEDLDEVIAIETFAHPRPWSRTHFLEEVRSTCAFCLVARGNGALLGYLCARHLLDEGEVLNVAVHPNSRGRGVGRLLMARGLAECRQRGARSVVLEVRLSNEPAKHLYRRFGFVVTGMRKRYYENGEDALLMEYCFNDEECR